MPKFQTTTNNSQQVWASPDGQRVIYQVALDYNGQTVSAKAYSKDIAQVGWTGEVETYEKEGRNGSEQFVKQPQKEGYSGGGSPSRSYGGGNSGGGSKPVGDTFTFYLAYAKDLMVASMAAGNAPEQSYTELLDAVLVGGYQLYAGRPGAENKPEAQKLPEGPGPKVATSPGEQTDTTTPTDTSALDKIFDIPTGPVTLEDTPWGK